MTAVLGATAGCGGASDDEARTVQKRARGTNVSALGASATHLTYQGRGRLDGVLPVLCECLRGLDVDHRVRASGSDRIVIDVPRDLPGQVQLSDVKAVALTGRLSLYDWEPLVIGPDGKPDPKDPAVTGGQAAGQVGGLRLYDAIVRAKDRPAKVEPDDDVALDGTAIRNPSRPSTRGPVPAARRS